MVIAVVEASDFVSGDPEHRKCTKVGEHKECVVEEDRCVSLCSIECQRRYDKACMRDRRVCEHTLDILLNQCHDICQCHCQDRKYQDDISDPLNTEIDIHTEDSDRDDKRRNLRYYRHISRKRCRSTLIDIRCPCMKREQRELECEGNHQQNRRAEYCNHRYRVDRSGHTCRKHFRYLIELDRACHCIDHSRPHRKEARSKCTHGEILHSRFIRVASVVQCDQRVE